MLTKNIETMKIEIARHIEADAVRGGTDCFITCLAHGGGPALLAERYGLPLPWVRIAENIFADLSFAERPVFLREMGEALGVDGKNLNRVVWRLLAATLRTMLGADPARPYVFARPAETAVETAVETVVEGMDLLAGGENWPGARDAYLGAEAAAFAADDEAYAAFAARDAARAACATSYAADAAARAADAAVYAARAADAARAEQRALFLRLMRDAPVEANA